MSGSSVVVLSPHLDDGVLSLGAAIRSWTRSGRAVSVLTVLGDDPDSSAASAGWDRSCGFATEGDAAGARREEERRACAHVGAVPVWLPFRDGEYGLPDDLERVWGAVEANLGGADTVLIPGFPLVHEDHSWLARLAFPKLLGRIERLGFYVEQPYAGNRSHLWPPRVSGELSPLPPGWHVEWRPVPVTRADRAAKVHAVKEYRSQIPALTKKPFFARRISRYDASRGGETVGWLARFGSSENHLS